MKRILLTLLIVILSCAAAVEVTNAHPGTGVPQINNEDIGPYRLFVWSDPPSPQVGEYHVSVALTESLPDDPSGFAGDAVLNADVMVTATHLESGEQLTAPATHENAINKIYYEAILELPRPGEWQVDLRVEGVHGVGEGSYVDVVEPATFNWIPLVAGIAAVLLAGAALLLYLRTQPRPATEPTVGSTTEAEAR